MTTYTPTLIPYTTPNPQGVDVIAFPGFPDGMFKVPEGDTYRVISIERIRRVACGVAEWLGLPPPTDVPDAYLYRAYRDLLDEGLLKYQETGEVCHACLREALIGLEGKRVEVINDLGDTIRFTVTRARGWLPCHLAIDKRGQTYPAPAVRFVRVLKPGRGPSKETQE